MSEVDALTPPVRKVIRERRRHRRVKVALDVRWTSHEVRISGWEDGESVNVSPSGMLFTGEMVFGTRPGTTMCVAIDVDGRTVVALARVVAVYLEEHRRARYGIEFTAFAPGDAKVLSAKLVSVDRNRTRSRV
jgi:hypothetical protein